MNLRFKYKLVDTYCIPDHLIACYIVVAADRWNLTAAAAYSLFPSFIPVFKQAQKKP
jgi:hypothetical protein